MADEDDDDNLDKAVESEEPDETPEKDLETEDQSPPTPIEEKEEAPDDETEKEIEESEDTGEDEASKKTDKQQIAEAADEEAAKNPEGIQTQPSTQLDRYQNFINEYRRLQDNRKKSDLAAGLAAAGGKIGQSLAGKYSGNFAPDLTGPKMIQQIGERPVQDLEQQQIVQGRGMQVQSTMQANDPTSPQSKLVRDYLNKRLGMNLPDNVSASDAQMLMKSMGRPAATKFQQMPMVSQKTGEKIMGTFNPSTNTFQDTSGNQLDSREWVRDYRAQSFVDPRTQERLGFNAGTGKVSGPLTGPGVNAPVVGAPQDLSQPAQLNRSFLTAQQAKQVDHTRDKFIQDVKDDRNNLNSTDRVIAALQSGKELGDLPREDQDQLNRAFGQKGHISDQQVNTILGKPDWKNRFANTVSIGLTGKLTDENRQFLLDTLGVVRGQNQQYIDNKSQIYTNNLYNDLKNAPNLQKYKFGPDSASNLLGVESARNPNVQSNKVKVRNLDTGIIGTIPKQNLQKALDSKKYEQVP